MVHQIQHSTELMKQKLKDAKIFRIQIFVMANIKRNNFFLEKPTKPNIYCVYNKTDSDQIVQKKVFDTNYLNGMFRCRSDKLKSQSSELFKIFTVFEDCFCEKHTRTTKLYQQRASLTGFLKTCLPSEGQQKR